MRRREMCSGGAGLHTEHAKQGWIQSGVIQDFLEDGRPNKRNQNSEG